MKLRILLALLLFFSLAGCGKSPRLPPAARIVKPWLPQAFGDILAAVFNHPGRPDIGRNPPPTKPKSSLIALPVEET